MTHPLSEELRKLAEKAAVSHMDDWEPTLEFTQTWVDALRRAADALDEQGGLVTKRDMAIAAQERDEVRRQAREIEAENRRLVDQCEELLRQLDDKTAWCSHYSDMEHAEKTRAERAEAQAARYREALEWYASQYYVFCKSNPSPCDTADVMTRDDGELARQALREPTTDEKEIDALIAVAEAAKSVLSEDGVKEHLSAYVMGCALIDRLAALETKP
jgi:hypothetical protein